MGSPEQHRRDRGPPRLPLPSEYAQANERRNGQYLVETPNPWNDGSSQSYDDYMPDPYDTIGSQPPRYQPPRAFPGNPYEQRFISIEETADSMIVRNMEPTRGRAPPVPQIPNGLLDHESPGLYERSFNGIETMSSRHETWGLGEYIRPRMLSHASWENSRRAPEQAQASQYNAGSLQNMTDWHAVVYPPASQRAISNGYDRPSTSNPMTVTESRPGLSQGAADTTRPDSSANEVSPAFMREIWAPPPPQPQPDPGSQETLQRTAYASVQNGTKFPGGNEPSEHSQMYVDPLVCPDCRAVFTLRKDRERHQRTAHRNGRPYLCPVQNCKYERRGFKRQDYLKKHIETMHPNPPPE